MRGTCPLEGSIMPERDLSCLKGCSLAERSLSCLKGGLAWLRGACPAWERTQPG
jgi:hypothetical protein